MDRRLRREVVGRADAATPALQGEVAYRHNVPLQVDDVQLIYASLTPFEAGIARLLGENVTPAGHCSTSSATPITGCNQLGAFKVGETITETARPTAAPFPGYRDAKPMVFAGLYSIEDTEYEALRDALEKLRLNDPAFTYEPETSLALGYGFRCGFLGMLHMEIVQEQIGRAHV